MTSVEHSRAIVVLLLLIHFFIVASIVLFGFMFGPCFVVYYLVSSLAIISLGKKESWLLYFNCLLMAFDGVLCLFLVVLYVGLQCMIVALPSYTHLLFHVIC